MKWHEMTLLGRTLILVYGIALIFSLIASLLLGLLVDLSFGATLAAIVSITVAVLSSCVYFIEWYLKRDMIGNASKDDA